jgi:hypothetical protein
MVYLIGVNHSCQYESPIDRKIVREERLAFQNHVLEITHKYNILLLAEEFSEEAKMKARVSESILEKLGKTEGIEQRFCDPLLSKKKRMGLQTMMMIGENNFGSHGFRTTRTKTCYSFVAIRTSNRFVRN